MGYEYFFQATVKELLHPNQAVTHYRSEYAAGQEQYKYKFHKTVDDEQGNRDFLVFRLLLSNQKRELLKQSVWWRSRYSSHMDVCSLCMLGLSSVGDFIACTFEDKGGITAVLYWL